MLGISVDPGVGAGKSRPERGMPLAQGRPHGAKRERRFARRGSEGDCSDPRANLWDDRSTNLQPREEGPRKVELRSGFPLHESQSTSGSSGSLGGSKAAVMSQYLDHVVLGFFIGRDTTVAQHCTLSSVVASNGEFEITIE